MLIVPLIGTLPVDEPRLILVDLIDLDKALHIATPFLLKVARRAKGTVTFAGMVRRIAAGEWQLWFVVNNGKVLACFGTHNYWHDDNKKTCDILFCTGTGMQSWVHLIEIVEDFARKQGCVRMTATARPGWLRVLPNYRMRHIEIEKEL